MTSDTVTFALREQRVSDCVQRNDPGRVAALDGCLGHAIDHARFFALGDGGASRCFDRAQSLCAVIAHAGKSFGGGLPELRRELERHGVGEPLWVEVPKSRFITLRGFVSAGIACVGERKLQCE